LGLIEISENLHRKELDAVDRSAHIAEWVRLVDERAKQQNLISRQVAAKTKSRGRGRPKGGVKAASRELGLDERQVRRAEKIDSIAPEAKDAAKDAGLADNQSALLKVAAVEGA
jgi:ParB family chromosome partitioning protein